MRSNTTASYDETFSLDDNLGGRYLDEITRARVDHITDLRLAEGVSNATVNRKPEVLRAIFQRLHRVRSAWVETRISRINLLRGLCSEFGITAPTGSGRGFGELRRRLMAQGVAIANKMARILSASWQRQRDFEFRPPRALAA